MTEDEPFIAGIRANPLDDLRRLVYADWLDERGRADEAEYLRLVAALAAAGTTVDPAHPHAVRLLELVVRLDDSWRERIGSRFDLWFDEFRLDRKIYFIKRVRDISGCGLLDAAAFCERLPQVLGGPLPLEEAVAQANATADAMTRYRIVPSTQSRTFDLRRRTVSMVLNARPRSQTENTTIALGHMRQILECDPEFAPLTADIQYAPDAGGREGVVYWVPLAKGLRGGEAVLKAKHLGLRLCGDDGRFCGNDGRIYGERTDPPFVGSLFISITD